jgi:hypothetical protein
MEDGKSRSSSSAVAVSLKGVVSAVFSPSCSFFGMMLTLIWSSSKDLYLAFQNFVIFSRPCPNRPKRSREAQVEQCFGRKPRSLHPVSSSTLPYHISLESGGGGTSC